MTLRTGDKLLDFQIPDQDGIVHKLADYRALAATGLSTLPER